MSSIAHFSLAQYELIINSGAFDGKHHQRVEFIRGEIRQQTSVSPGHAEIVSRLMEFSFLTDPRPNVLARVSATVPIALLNSAPQVDFAWFEPDDYWHRFPTECDAMLFVEVADSSLNYDTGEKARLYAEAGIADYWVVNLVDKCIEVFRDPSPSGYKSRTTFRGDEEIRPLAFADAILQPSQIFKG